MKNIPFQITGIVFTLMFISMLTIPAYGTQAIRVRIEGEFFQIPDDYPQPKIVESTVIVPLRVFMETLGFTVEWDEQAQSAIMTKPGYNVFVNVGGNYMVVTNGFLHLASLDHIPAKIVDNHMMVALRAIGEVARMGFWWDNVNCIADIGSIPERRHDAIDKPANWPEYLPQYTPGSINLLPDNYHLQFREVFYLIPPEFIDLVPLNERSNICVDGYPDIEAEPIMPLMNFVLVNNISRKDFDAAVVRLEERIYELATRENIDPNNEMFEIPNADIIFTFDMEIIRYFYRRA